MVLSIIERFHVLHVLNDHKGDLECDRIFKNPQIQTCTLLKLIQTVYQCISVNVQLTRGLGHIQRIFKKFIDRCQCFLIKVIR